MNQEEILRWKKDGGLELEYAFEGMYEDSIVFDVGMYKGKWAREIARRYGCTVYGFEPVKEFYKKAQDVLSEFPKVKIFNYGVGRKKYEAGIVIDDDASSLMGGKGERRIVEIVGIEEIMEKLGVKFVDLIEINIEGAEYQLLEHLIETGMILRFNRLLIQFHDIGGDEERRKKIREKLCLTHNVIYSYDLVWDSWVRHW